MQLNEIIESRRALRSLKPIRITDQMVNQLVSAASLAPSCFNKQPWRFIFIREPALLDEVKKSIKSPGNDWAQNASMVVAVHSRTDLDCIISEREYYLFDTGTATGFMLLKGTEMGLVMHPIAGFNESLAKKTLGIPETHRLITLVIVGAKADSINPILNESQIRTESERPARLQPGEYAQIR